jgi:predicted  nucleic acid-binding Zn-ribbon protein
MNPDLQKLIELEQINQEIARLRQEVADLPRRVAAIEEKLAGAKARVQAAQSAIKDQESARRKLESEIQDRQQKISKFRDQSLSVKTNEQYKALMHEIEFAQQEIGGFEEKILLGMEANDENQRKLKSAEAELKADAQEVEKEKEHARSLTAQDEEKLKQLNGERDHLRQQIDASALAHYERIAQKRRPAITEALDQKCSACNVMVRPQRYSELLSGSVLVTCDSCGRILYRDPARATTENGGAGRQHERAWFYLPEWNGSSVFAYFTNSKTSCTMRAYSSLTGEPVAKVVRKKPSFREAFADELHSGTPLHPALTTGGHDETLSSDLLEDLQLQAGVTVDQSAPATN